MPTAFRCSGYSWPFPTFRTQHARHSTAAVERLLKPSNAPRPCGQPVVATGGLAAVIAPYSRTITEHEPWLTLHGLRLVFDRNNS